MTKKNILITRDHISEPAVTELNNQGFECIFSPPYEHISNVIAKAKDYKIQAIMVSQGQITRDLISASDKLSVIVKHGSGVNNINLATAEELNIPVYRALGANAQAVAEHAITLILNLWKSISRLDHLTKSGKWIKSEFSGNDFNNAKLGLIGFGEIGRYVSQFAMAFGMKVIAFDPAITKNIDNVEFVDNIDELTQSADIISIHCPYTPKTHHLINAERLSKMQNHAVLVNTARGGIVDETALFIALQNNQIAGAALDSFETEPPEKKSLFWSAKNLIVTPHIGGVTKGAEQNMAMTAAQFIIDHFNGKEIHPRFKALAVDLGGLTE